MIYGKGEPKLSMDSPIIFKSLDISTVTRLMQQETIPIKIFVTKEEVLVLEDMGCRVVRI